MMNIVGGTYMIILPTKKELPYVDYKLGKKCSIMNEIMVIKYGCQLVEIRLSHLSVLVRVVNNLFYRFAHVQYRLFENLQAWLRGICSIPSTRARGYWVLRNSLIFSLHYIILLFSFPFRPFVSLISKKIKLDW